MLTQTTTKTSLNGSTSAPKNQLTQILHLLKRTYPEAGNQLIFNDTFELLVAAILSAQTTDEQVNTVTPTLFAKYPDAAALAQADRRELQTIIQSLGFARQKNRYLITASQILVHEYDGEVPDTLHELVKLSGVARKTANIVLQEGFNTVEGIAVDSYVRRVATRLQLTAGRSTETVESDLTTLVPEAQWGEVGYLFAALGHDCCTVRNPECTRCPVAKLCPSAAALNQG
jgi:endonuclease-3